MHKNVPVFVLVFLCAVTMLIFEIKRIISSENCDFIASWAASRPENLVPLALKTYFLI